MRTLSHTHSRTLSRPPPRTRTGGNPDSNTLTSEMTTVICLDDYHMHDRNGRKVAKVTALDEKAQNFDLMAEQVQRFAASWLSLLFLSQLSLPAPCAKCRSHSQCSFFLLVWA